MNILKTVAKLAKNHTVLFTVVAAVALILIMKNYSIGKGLGGIQGLKNKNTSQDAMAKAVPLQFGQLYTLVLLCLLDIVLLFQSYSELKWYVFF